MGIVKLYIQIPNLKQYGLNLQMKTKYLLKFILLVLTIIFLVLIWTRGGLDKVFLDSDMGRDLSEISKLWIGQKVIWLGPRFSMGLHSSPFYYYLFYIPILISRGSAYSLIIFNVVLAALSLAFLGYICIKKYGIKGILVPLAIGIMPWWQEIAIHPGNGFTYAIFLLASLSALWFKLPFFASALFFGISASMHPGAFFILPYFVYEAIKRKLSLKNFAISSAIFLLPFIPLIAFEIITRGYWLKQWLIQPNYGFNFGFDLSNIINFFLFSGINLYIGFVLMIFMVFYFSKRERVWLTISLIYIILLLFINEVPKHYLYGVIVIFWIASALSLIQKSVGRLILIFLILYFSWNTLVLQGIPKASQRPISKIIGATEYLIQSGAVNKNDNLAVLVIKGDDTKTPQADDYRFFLRVKGYQVEEMADYFKADKLIIFVEDINSDWENWNTWDTNQFGEKVLSDKIEINDIIMAVYIKQNAI